MRNRCLSSANFHCLILTRERKCYQNGMLNNKEIIRKILGGTLIEIHMPVIVCVYVCLCVCVCVCLCVFVCVFDWLVVYLLSEHRVRIFHLENLFSIMHKKRHF